MEGAPSPKPRSISVIACLPSVIRPSLRRPKRQTCPEHREGRTIAKDCDASTRSFPEPTPHRQECRPICKTVAAVGRNKEIRRWRARKSERSPPKGRSRWQGQTQAETVGTIVFLVPSVSPSESSQRLVQQAGQHRLRSRRRPEQFLRGRLS